MSEDSIETKPVIDRARRRASRTRKRLLDSALTLFSQKGVDVCSIENITELADLGKGTFYRHFEDKHAILNALVDQAISELIERIEARKDQATSFETVIAQIVDAHLSFFSERNELFAVVLQTRLISSLRQTVDGRDNDPFTRYLTTLEKKAAPFIPTSATKPQHLRRCILIIAGFLSGFFALSGGKLRREEIASTLKLLRSVLNKGAVALVAEPDAA